MSNSIAQRSLPTPLLLPEKSRRQAKVTLPGIRKAEKSSQWVKHGAAMREVQHVFCLTLKEFAAALEKDERQIERQMAGQERPQIEVVLAIERFEGAMLIALARSASGVAVDTVIHVRRSA